MAMTVPVAVWRWGYDASVSGCAEKGSSGAGVMTFMLSPSATLSKSIW